MAERRWIYGISASLRMLAHAYKVRSVDHNDLQLFCNGLDQV